MSRISFLLQFLLLITHSIIHAQVPVREEPHHKPVLENDYVRLLDVHLNSNDTTQYHIHATPSVIVILSNSIIGSQKSGEAPSAPGNVIAGATSFIDYGTNPITHRVFNAGNNIFHVMDIELVKKAPLADSCKAWQQPDVQTTISQKLVRVYKFDVNANQALKINENSCAHLLVCVNGTISSLNKTIKTGEYIFFNPLNEISLENNRSANATCVLLELK